MHIVKTLIAAAVIAAPVAVLAKKPTAGSYSASGIQSICLQADGTWYGESFGGWGGKWTQIGKNLVLRGNYASGVGNDALNFTGSSSLGYNGDWQEWRDDGSYDYAQAATLTFESSSCSAAPAVVQGGKAHPTQQ